MSFLWEHFHFAFYRLLLLLLILLISFVSSLGMPPFRVTRALLILALMLSSSFFLVANFSIRRATHLTRVANLLSPEVPSHPAESVSELTNPVYRPVVRGKRSPLGRNDYESEDSPSSTLIAFIVLAVFVGIPCFLCYSRKCKCFWYNFRMIKFNP